MVDISFLNEDIALDQAAEFRHSAKVHGMDAKLRSDTTIMHVLKRASNAQIRGDMNRHNYWMRLAYQKLINTGN